MLKKRLFLFLPIFAFLATLLWLLLAGEQESAAVREGVVRYHIVAHSDSAEDQAVKLLLRDHLFAEIEAIFAPCKNAQEALAAARENQALLKEKGEAFLKAQGKERELQVVIGERFFPTKNYGKLFFPAGRYQAVSILIGEGKGENFWCVLYPALCLSPAVANEESAERLAPVIGAEAAEFLQKGSEIQKVKFWLVEWFELLRQKIKKS